MRHGRRPCRAGSGAYSVTVSTTGDVAIVGGKVYSRLADITSDVSALDGSGQWIVVAPFEGMAVCARFDRVRRLSPRGWPRGRGAGLAARAADGGAAVGAWTSSLDRAAYIAGVTTIREAIAAGDVYQVNLCRRLSAPLTAPFDAVLFGSALSEANPAPHSAVVSLPSAGLHVVSASPERFLRRDGRSVESRPIKGTAAAADGLGAKDRAENVMIVDLVRNDLGRVCDYGSVVVDGLCEVEEHPGLVHLVSTVRGHLRLGCGWADLLAACFPPGSVTGAPKQAALGMIRALEPVGRDLYCGAIGWVDADRGRGDLNVAIRTFWTRDSYLHLGTGAGITWDSDADREWEETELKTARLLSVIQGRAPEPDDCRPRRPAAERLVGI